MVRRPRQLAIPAEAGLDDRVRLVRRRLLDGGGRRLAAAVARGLTAPAAARVSHARDDGVDRRRRQKLRHVGCRRARDCPGALFVRHARRHRGRQHPRQALRHAPLRQRGLRQRGLERALVIGADAARLSRPLWRVASLWRLDRARATGPQVGLQAVRKAIERPPVGLARARRPTARLGRRRRGDARRVCSGCDRRDRRGGEPGRCGRGGRLRAAEGLMEGGLRRRGRGGDRARPQSERARLVGLTGESDGGRSVQRDGLRGGGRRRGGATRAVGRRSFRRTPAEGRRSRRAAGPSAAPVASAHLLRRERLHQLGALFVQLSRAARRGGEPSHETRAWWTQRARPALRLARLAQLLISEREHVLELLHERRHPIDLRHRLRAAARPPLPFELFALLGEMTAQLRRKHAEEMRRPLALHLRVERLGACLRTRRAVACAGCPCGTQRMHHPRRCRGMFGAVARATTRQPSAGNHPSSRRPPQPRCKSAARRAPTPAQACASVWSSPPTAAPGTAFRAPRPAARRAATAHPPPCLVQTMGA
eukprot:7391726-Prymnesium_polylepis.1